MVYKNIIIKKTNVVTNLYGIERFFQNTLILSVII